MRRNGWIRGVVVLAVWIGFGTLLFAAQTQPLRSQVEDTTFFELAVDGRTRSYYVYEPDGLSNEGPRPLVIAIHGGEGNANNIAEQSHLSAVADAEGFLVVYPNGSGRRADRLLTWNAGNCCGYAQTEQIDDVAFISALIDTMIADYNVDPAAVFLTGLSNGGMMSHRVGCELSAQVTAIAPVAGALNLTCTPTDPVGVFIIHGTDDQHVLYEGGTPHESFNDDVGDRVDTPVLEGAAIWADRNGCDETTTTTAFNEDVSLLTYRHCTGAPVVVVTIEGGQHAWPGGRSWLRGDDVYMDYDASAEMWAFFATFLDR